MTEAEIEQLKTVLVGKYIKANWGACQIILVLGFRGDDATFCVEDERGDVCFVVSDIFQTTFYSTYEACEQCDRRPRPSKQPSEIELILGADRPKYGNGAANRPDWSSWDDTEWQRQIEKHGVEYWPVDKLVGPPGSKTYVGPKAMEPSLCEVYRPDGMRRQR